MKSMGAVFNRYPERENLLIVYPGSCSIHSAQLLLLIIGCVSNIKRPLSRRNNKLMIGNCNRVGCGNDIWEDAAVRG